jgi:hypothetical protein
MNKDTYDWTSPFYSKKAYIAVLFAVIGTLIIHFIFGIENKTVVFLICLAFSFFSYFVIAPKIIKKAK